MIYMESSPSHDDEQIRIVKLSSWIFSVLAFEVFLVAMHLAASYSGSYTLTIYFDLNREQTIASWFSAGQLLIIGMMMYVIGSHSNREFWPSSMFCRLVGMGFVFLSLDETVSIHESMSELTRRHFSTSVEPVFNGQYGSWIFVYGVLGAGLAIAMRRDLTIMWRYHRRSSVTIAMGFAVLFSGAVIVEIAGYYQIFRLPMIQVAIEEFLEMVGATIMLAGVIAFFKRSVQLRAVP